MAKRLMLSVVLVAASITLVWAFRPAQNDALVKAGADAGHRPQAGSSVSIPTSETPAR